MAASAVVGLRQALETQNISSIASSLARCIDYNNLPVEFTELETKANQRLAAWKGTLTAGAYIDYKCTSRKNTWCLVKILSRTGNEMHISHVSNTAPEEMIDIIASELRPSNTYTNTRVPGHPEGTRRQRLIAAQAKELPPASAPAPAAVKKRKAENIPEPAKRHRSSASAYHRWTADRDPPLCIDYVSLEPMLLPTDFASKAAAERAAKDREHIARYMGTVALSLSGITPELLSGLRKGHQIDPMRGRNVPRGVQWNEDGEFSTPEGQIPLSRLLDMEYFQRFTFTTPLDKRLMQTLMGLQSANASPWKHPFLRLISTYAFHAQKKTCVVTYHVYFTRFVFELIANAELQFLVSHLRLSASIQVTPCHPRETLRRPMFQSTAPPALPGIKHSQDDFDFSLTGLLHKAESQGFAIHEKQPAGLKVDLFEYQLSTYNWMLHQERLPHLGLNSCLWETWRMADGCDLYYFPIAGEFRLSSPPVTHGGLLCEEMGLGKTVEVLSLILGNPFVVSAEEESLGASTGKKPIGATLIIVPSILASQWWREIHLRTSLDAINLSARTLNHQLVYEEVQIPMADLRVTRIDQNPNGEWGNFRHFESTFTTTPNKVFHTEHRCEVRFDWLNGHHIAVEILRSVGINSLRVRFSLLDSFYKHDVVLTTYEKFRANAAIYKRLRWHRVILDECQEVKVSTSDIAEECANLDSHFRWMVSGTPFVSSVYDLHGELNFLRIWPFCLSDRTDGFWESKVGGPFRARDRNALALLHTLIDTAMLRHSKSQRYIDGRPLLRMPARTVEWRGFELGNSSEQYLYRYLESFAAEALRLTLTSDILQEVSFQKCPNYAHIKACVALMQCCISHPDAVDLRRLDNYRRRMIPVVLGSFGTGPGGRQRITGSAEAYGVPTMSAERALQQLQALGSGDMGLNRDSNRTLVNTVVTELEAKIAEEFVGLDVKALRREVEEQGLPMPMHWLSIKPRVHVRRGSNILTCIAPPVPSKSSKQQSKQPLKPQLPLTALVKVGDILRIDETSLLESECEVVFVEDAFVHSSAMPGDTDRTLMGTIHVKKRWDSEDVEDGKVFRHIMPTRTEPYIQLLVAKRLTMQKGLQTARQSDIHEIGFETLYRLIAGRPVECPLCLSSDAVRPTVTKCVHAHCFDCIADVILREKDNAKCPCCRRPISFGTLIEVEVTNVGIEEKPEEAPREVPPSSAAPPSQDAKKSSSSRSSSSSSALHAAMKDMESDTALIVPELTLEGIAATAADLAAIPRPHGPLLARVPDLPSLDPLPLTHFNLWRKELLVRSSRMLAMFDDMNDVFSEDPSAKFVIFSQFPETLVAMHKRLQEQGSLHRPVRAVMVNSNMSSIEKEASLRRFNDEPACNVILLLMGSASSGLTLTVAHICYIMEPGHNAAEEAQALNRVHRIGQNKSVRCVIFYAKDTVEERLLGVRKSRGMLTELLQSSSKGKAAAPSGNAAETDAGKFFDAPTLQILFGVKDVEEPAARGDGYSNDEVEDDGEADLVHMDDDESDYDGGW